MSTTDQIYAVIALANKAGYPDAADWIQRAFEGNTVTHPTKRPNPLQPLFDEYAALDQQRATDDSAAIRERMVAILVEVERCA